MALTVFSLIADAYVLSRPGEVGPAAQLVVDLVDMDAEANAPAFYSTMLLAAAGVLLAVIAFHQLSVRVEGAWYWALLSVLFFGLALDEAASLHETMIVPFRRLFPDNRFVYFGWVVPGAAFVLVVGSLFLRFLRKLDVRTRNLFVIAGVVFVGGALGIEVLEGYIASGIGEDNWTYVSALTTQELLEMVGVIIFIYALLEHMRTLTSGIDFHWSGADRQVDAAPEPSAGQQPSPESLEADAAPATTGPANDRLRATVDGEVEVH